ncbi:hypothetical protein M513_11957, partial [Trichuris suis]
SSYKRGGGRRRRAEKGEVTEGGWERTQKVKRKTKSGKDRESKTLKRGRREERKQKQKGGENKKKEKGKKEKGRKTKKQNKKQEDRNETKREVICSRRPSWSCSSGAGNSYRRQQFVARTMFVQESLTAVPRSLFMFWLCLIVPSPAVAFRIPPHAVVLLKFE